MVAPDRGDPAADARRTRCGAVAAREGKLDARILVVEADSMAASRVLRELMGAGHACRWCRSGAQALDAAQGWRPSLAILGLPVPDMDARELCHHLRRHGTPGILAMADTSAEEGWGQALSVGAEDVVRKPIQLDELRWRTEALLQRLAEEGATQPSGAREPGSELIIDTAARRAWIGEHELRLTPHERGVLVHFGANRGRVLGTDEILHAAWGPGYAGNWQVLREVIHTLRRKIDAASEPGRGAECIVTIHAEGYLLR